MHEHPLFPRGTRLVPDSGPRSQVQVPAPLHTELPVLLGRQGDAGPQPRPRVDRETRHTPSGGPHGALELPDLPSPSSALSLPPISQLVHFFLLLPQSLILQVGFSLGRTRTMD